MRKEFQFVSDEDLAAARNEEKEEIVKKMIQQNYSDQQIIGVTDADEKQINAIRLALNNH